MSSPSSNDNPDSNPSSFSSYFKALTSPPSSSSQTYLHSLSSLLHSPPSPPTPLDASNLSVALQSHIPHLLKVIESGDFTTLSTALMTRLLSTIEAPTTHLPRIISSTTATLLSPHTQPPSYPPLLSLLLSLSPTKASPLLDVVFHVASMRSHAFPRSDDYGLWLGLVAHALGLPEPASLAVSRRGGELVAVLLACGGGEEVDELIGKIRGKRADEVRKKVGEECREKLGARVGVVAIKE